MLGRFGYFRRFKNIFVSLSQFSSIQSRMIITNNKAVTQSNFSRLSSTLSNDYTNWGKDDLIKKIQELEAKIAPVEEKKNKKQRRKPEKVFDFSKHNTRHVGLRFSYLGWNYQGLAVQKDDTELPTVEFEILRVLEKLKLIPSKRPIDCNFSRCGRTDRGVSAMNQVISLNIRSKLTKEQLEDPANDELEFNYIHMLNKLLPPDIRFHSICLRPPQDFDARFSCIFRHYKYIFSAAGINVGKMKEGAEFFVGEHDFRNFCKLDPSKQLTHFNRRVDFVDITPLPGRPEYLVFDLKGSAFLWHQVRCMMAVLFSVGQGFEEPQIVSRLLDSKVFPSRPVYTMAHEYPLVLYDCGFRDNVIWTNQSGKGFSNYDFEVTYQDYQVKASMIGIMKDILSSKNKHVETQDRLMTGRGEVHAFKKYVPLEQRPVMETYEETNRKWKEKKRTFSEMVNNEVDSIIP